MFWHTQRRYLTLVGLIALSSSQFGLRAEDTVIVESQKSATAALKGGPVQGDQNTAPEHSAASEDSALSVAHVAQKDSLAQKNGPAPQRCLVPQPVEMRWETIKKQCTRTVYESVTEERQKVVYDTHYDTQTVHDVHRVSETHYRQEEFSHQVPVYDTQIREIPFTLHRPIYETRSRDVNYVTYTLVPETRTRQVPYTTYHTVQEQRTRTVPYTVPREISYTTTIPIHTGCWETHVEEHPGQVIKKCVQEPGCWEWDPCRCCCVYKPGASRTVEVQCPPVKVCKRVWVPKVEQRVVNRTKVVYETHTKQVPYSTTRLVPTTHTREVTYTFTRQVPMTNTRTVYYQVRKLIPEQHTRSVTQLVKRMTTETGTRTVPYTVWKEVPSERTITVPRTVPRTVTYTVTKCVPRTETYEVDVRVCRPVTKSAGAAQSAGPVQRDGAAQNQKDNPAEMEGSVKQEEELESGDKSQPSDEAQATPAVAMIRSADSVLPQTALTLTSLTTATPFEKPATQWYSEGLQQYNRGDFENAQTSLAQATRMESQDARYAYFWALAAKQLGDTEQASKALTIATQREVDQPVKNWGRAMERVQGSIRLWLEEARRDTLTKQDA